MNKEYLIKDLESLNDFASELAKTIQGIPYSFQGDLGAGKTTLIKMIGKHLGVKSEMSSPSFAIINEYSTQNKAFNSLYHMDLYRLNDIEEAYDIGIEEYLYSSNPSFIEWSEIIHPILPKETIFIKIEILDNSSRKIVFL